MADYAITRIPDNEYEELRIICIRNKKTVAEVIRKLISDYVRKKS